MERHLHIVSFNVPLPADYGGVIDVFYRIKALSDAGIKIHLHCFTYGRKEVPELNRYCTEVHYYRRATTILRMVSGRPYIVSSRKNSKLRQRLLQDHYPILLEGLHCCSLLTDDEVCCNRTVMVRAHNVESQYYSQLAAAEHSPLQKLYLNFEAAKIKRFEPLLSRADAVFAISESDKTTLENMGCNNVTLMTGAHPYSKIESKIGHGDYALYHGNLAVAENYRAVEYLVDNIFVNNSIRLVVAGGNPPQWLKNKLTNLVNVKLEANPDDTMMRRLISESQVCLLVTEQPTGLKLKLLSSLFCGRHCLVNSNMVAGSGLEELCVVADDAETQRKQLAKLMSLDFGEEQILRRNEMLKSFITGNAIKPLLDLI